MTPSETTNREKLFSHIPEPRLYGSGISGKDIARIVVTPSLVADTLDCLASKDDLDIGFALFYLEELNSRSDFRVALGSSKAVVLARIRKLLDHANMKIRVDAVAAFVAFRKDFNDYSPVMFDLLRSPDTQIRRVAIGATPTFLPAKKLDELLRFRDEPTWGETGGMGGPMRYVLRDFELEMAECITGKSFQAGDCFDMQNGVQISWRSWSAFTIWLENNKKWSLISK